MGRVISSGYDEYTIHAITHGAMSDRTLDALRARARSSDGRMSDRLRAFRDQSLNRLETLDLSLVRDRVRRVEEKSTRLYELDIIKPLRAIEDFQLAKPVNRNTLMLHPRARKLYYEGRTAGFHGEFVDDEPGRYGRDHTQWRELMSGSFVDDGEDSGFVTYLEDDLIEHNRDERSFDEKLTIRDNHARLDELFDEGVSDPLDQLGGNL